MPQLPTVPEGVLSPRAKRTYDLAKWFAGLTASMIGVVAALLWALSTLGLVSFGAEAKAEAKPPSFTAAADLQALKSSLDALRLQTAETAAKVERLDDRLRDVQIDVGALKAASERRR